MAVSAAACLFAAVNLQCASADEDSVFPDSSEIVLSASLSGHYVLSGDRYGYAYDVLDDFFSSFSQTPRYRSSRVNVTDSLWMDGAEAAIVPTRDVPDVYASRSVVLYSSFFSLLTVGSRYSVLESGEPTPDMLAGARILVPDSFVGSSGFVGMMQEASSVVTDSSDDFARAREVAYGRADFAVLEYVAAKGACRLYRQLRETATYGAPLSVSVVFRTEEEAELFGKWLDEYTSSGDIDYINDFYFGQGMNDELMQMARSGRRGVIDGISGYDGTFRAVGEREGVDWRLLSAIAYNESGFDPDAVSQKGAVGIMQIMPSTMRRYVSVDSLMADSELNITAAARLIASIESNLDIDPAVGVTDKICMVLAAYNCGEARLNEAVRVARSLHGGVADWEHVSACLESMSDYSFVRSHSVSTGVFRRSRQTLKYVSAVMDRYEAYCRALR